MAEKLFAEVAEVALVRVVLAFLAGLVVSYLVIVMVGILYMDVAGIVDRDGGGTMGLAFTLGPIGAPIGGTAAAIFTYAYTRRHPRAAEDDGAHQTPAARQKRIVLVALIAGLAAYLAASFGVWLQSGASYESYWTALLVGWSPILVGLVAAALAGWIAARR